ncbi:HIT family protein [Parendozoicomonas haliclonae]|uniref:Purine nucleoside phosphoramidase n=1 Tax=Parendozoicomonas haliclonae TaxID=1960125 RepID=A0A1X7AKU4_9GAMM|nr:HIT family protein [Parendozoicomonas haliclonae]SMA47599.1 purine nucleoside phosphoramidase [Parendozoicomonas haliclonae]
MHSHTPDHYACPFCRILNSKEEHEAEVIYQNRYAYVCLPLEHRPTAGPPVMVIPKIHTESIYTIDEQHLSEVILLAKRVAMVMKKLWQLDGITLLQNNEPAGGQDVWHFHLHVKGRRSNDNFYNTAWVRIPAEQRAQWIEQLRSAMHTTYPL